MNTTHTPPLKALSLVQPWAWLLVNGIKDVENRTWPTKHTGWTYIHASLRKSCDDYDQAVRLLEKHNRLHGTNHQLPMFNALDRGSLVGLVNFSACVAASDSLWFFGPYGFLASESKVISPIPCKGALGFFVPPIQSLAVVSQSRPNTYPNTSHHRKSHDSVDPAPHRRLHPSK